MTAVTRRPTDAILDRLSPSQRRRLAEFQASYKEMRDMRLDNYADVVVGRAQGFIEGALGSDLSDAFVKRIIADAYTDFFGREG